MGNFLRWLINLFRGEVSWVERGQGRWRKQRQYHPVARIFFVLAVLGILWGGVELYHYHLRALHERVEETEDLSADTSIQDNDDDMPETDHFPEETASVPPDPGPIPSELTVGDDEYWVRIVKSNFQLYLYRGGEVDRSYLVAVGRNPGDKERIGDNRTPNGIFTVQSIENSSSWTFDFRDGNGPISGAYGPWFIRLRTGWRGIGIHGTHDPASLGTMSSEGCIRMRNEELEELRNIAFRDMKVVIEE